MLRRSCLQILLVVKVRSKFLPSKSSFASPITGVATSRATESSLTDGSDNGLNMGGTTRGIHTDDVPSDIGNMQNESVLQRVVNRVKKRLGFRNSHDSINHRKQSSLSVKQKKHVGTIRKSSSQPSLPKFKTDEKTQHILRSISHLTNRELTDWINSIRGHGEPISSNWSRASLIEEVIRLSS